MGKIIELSQATKKQNMETLEQLGQSIKKRLKCNKKVDVVEKNCLIAIIDGDDAEFNRLNKIMSRRKRSGGLFRVVR